MVLSIDPRHDNDDTGLEGSAPPSLKEKRGPEFRSEKGLAVTVKDSLPGAESTSSPGSSCALVEEDEVAFWNPTSLSRPVLGTFLALFIIMLASLQVIDSYAARHHGLAKSDQSKHYLWTYGPTAVLVVVAALWRQVDYETKLLMPWAQMRKGSSGADQTMLLDYNSPLLVVSFIKSCRNLHFPVSLTILGFVLIKVLTVLSTGLLGLEDIPILESPTRLVLTNRFDAANFSQGAAVDSRPYYAVFGRQNANLPLPKGTTDYNAVQSFEVSSENEVPVTAELVGSVDIFGADLDCEAAGMTYTNTTSHWGRAESITEYHHLSVSSDSCQAFQRSLNITDNAGPVTSFGYRSLMEIVNCTNVPDGDESKRLLIAVTYLKEVEDTQTMVNSTALLCIPSYKINRGEVALNRSSAMSYGVQVLSLDTDASRTLAGLSAWDLVHGVLNSALSVHSLDTTNQPGLSLGTFLGMAFDHSKTNITDFIVPEVLIDESRRLFRLITTQIAAQFLMVPVDQEIDGSFNDFDILLVPRRGPLRAMQGVLAVLTVVTATLLFIRPRNVLPRSAESIGGLATILARSGDALQSLKGLGHVSHEDFQATVRQWSYKTVIAQRAEGHTFRIEAKDATQEKIKLVQKVDGVSLQRWWRPVAFSLPMIIFTLTSPLAIIAALEATLQQSLKDGGLADVDVSSTHRYTWIYTPTIIFVLVATLFNVLDFHVASIQPYQTLMKGNATGPKSIQQTPLHRTALSALYDRIIAGYLPVVATSIAVIVAPMLMIVVSGLVTFTQVPFSGPVITEQATWFNITPNQEYSGAEAANTLNLIVGGNLTYPRWTYEELAFSSITIQPSAGESSEQYLEKAQYLNMVLPALRGRFNCTPWPINSIHYAKINMESNISAYNIGTLKDTEAGRVVVDGAQLLLTLYDDQTGNIASADAAMNHYHLSFEDVMNQLDEGYYAIEASTPGLLFYVHLKDQIVDDFTITRCSPFVEQVDVNITLTLSDYAITAARPPKTLDNTAKLFAPNPPDVNPDFGTLTTAFQELNTPDGNVFSPFFQALVHGKDGIPAAELMDQRRLIAASEHLYAIYKAQYLNAFHRIPVPQPSRIPNATYVFEQRIRLQQSALSTRFLQGILALLWVCGFVVYAVLWMDTKGSRRVVPRNPHSIASVACLLVGSELLEGDLIPDGAEWWDDGKVREVGLFDNLRFSLGWWEDGGRDGGSRFGIDIGKPQDRADSEAISRSCGKS